jgi:hypothetical protein
MVVFSDGSCEGYKFWLWRCLIGGFVLDEGVRLGLFDGIFVVIFDVSIIGKLDGAKLELSLGNTDKVGKDERNKVGRDECFWVDSSDGSELGSLECSNKGICNGFELGLLLGRTDILGETDSNGDGFEEGTCDDAADGSELGSLEGSNEGICDGFELGLSLASTEILGEEEGVVLGWTDGDRECSRLGK